MSQRSRTSLGSSGRKLRYRNLLQDLSTLEDENVTNVKKIEKTKYVVREAEALLNEGGLEERVKHPAEGYLDSQVLRASSDVAIRCSEAVTGNAYVYDQHELAQHIREKPSFWEFMFPREVPMQAYLFGTFAPTPLDQRPRAPRRRVEKQQAAALKAPENVDRLEKLEEGSEMVSQVKKFIRTTYKNTAQQPLSYFHTVLDPHSFSRTIENIYYLAFLVKDGDVTVELDPEYELPMVSPVSKQTAAHGATSHHQFIVSIDMPRWQELIEAFDIRQPMMVLKRNTTRDERN